MSEDDVFEYLEHPFNPPVIKDKFTEDAFFEEWHAAQERIDSALLKLGNRDDLGRADYSMGDTANFSRGISVVLTSRRMINRRTVRCIQNVLSSLSEAYEVYLQIELDGEITHLLIARDTLKGCSPFETAVALGLDFT